MTAQPDFLSDQSSSDTPCTGVAQEFTPIDLANGGQKPKRCKLDLSDPLLNMAAEVLDDLEKARISNENRLRQLTRSVEDKDGELRGFGLSLNHPDVNQLAALVKDLRQAEHRAELNLKRTLRKHPLGSWIKNTHGIGEKQGARLLAALGDPYWHPAYDRPCTVSELWAYCGYHVLDVNMKLGSDSGHGTEDAHRSCARVAASRTRGVKINWSPLAKMRTFLITESIVKVGGSYRTVYDQGREKYADAVHQVPCVRCGPSGHPAMPGSALSKGHQHARALRLVAKEVLKDLWIESRRLHLEHDQLQI
jgi:hypothetical protein